MQTFEWAIEDIVAAHPNLYLEHCAVMAVALMSRQSTSPLEFLVECEGFSPVQLHGEAGFRLLVGWSERTAAAATRAWVTEQGRPIVERAAVALAALTVGYLIPDSQMHVTEVGERADYWLPGLACALEISGTEHSREVPRRHRQKLAQMLANPRGWGGFVFVCCFDEVHRLIRWSFHSQEEHRDATS